MAATIDHMAQSLAARAALDVLLFRHRVPHDASLVVSTHARNSVSLQRARYRATQYCTRAWSASVRAVDRIDTQSKLLSARARVLSVLSSGPPHLGRRGRKSTFQQLQHDVTNRPSYDHRTTASAAIRRIRAHHPYSIAQ
jgi:hypothetical protein